MEDANSGEKKNPAPFLEGAYDVVRQMIKQMYGHGNLRMAEAGHPRTANDQAQSDRAKQGSVFTVGEILEIRGGQFQVTRTEPGHLRLKSVSGVYRPTRCRKLNDLPGPYVHQK